MSGELKLLGGLGLGAGLMYFLDPEKGRRRRALAGDQVVGALSRIDDCMDVAMKDLGHRAQGLWAETCSRMHAEEVSDRVVVARVRSKLGRHVSHPHSVGIAAHNGQVVVTGSVLNHEVDCLLKAISNVRGVTGVDASGLVVHDESGNLPWLQGGSHRSGERVNFREESWSPASRLLAGTLGCGLMGNCLAQGTPLAILGGTLGFGLFLRSVTNVDLGRLVGATGGCRAVDIQKTITIVGPVERVFPFFAHYDTFPRFMAHLREVQDLGNGRSRWVAEGPAGATMSWEAVITQFEPDRLLAWRSEPGSVIANAGMIRFERAPNDSTRVIIRLSYNPPGGVLGHLAAKLFGADAKSAMEDDLMRLKGLIEEGKTHAPGKEDVARQDVLASLAR